MKLDEYQAQAAKTDTFAYKKIDDLLASDPAYVAKVLGLVGEAGEVAEKFKKIIRDKKGKLSESDRREIVKELGDVLWYTALIAKYLDTSLENVASLNLDKLASRKARKTIQGSGDNR